MSREIAEELLQDLCESLDMISSCYKSLPDAVRLVPTSLDILGVNHPLAVPDFMPSLDHDSEKVYIVGGKEIFISFPGSFLPMCRCVSESLKKVQISWIDRGVWNLVKERFGPALESCDKVFNLILKYLLLKVLGSVGVVTVY